MEIVPGELFVVHYKFPSGQQKFDGDDLRNGVTMPIPNTHANLNFGRSEEGDVTVEYKVSFQYWLYLWKMIYVDGSFVFRHQYIFQHLYDAINWMYTVLLDSVIRKFALEIDEKLETNNDKFPVDEF